MSWIDIYETPPFIVFLQVQSPSDFSRVLTGTQRSAPVPRPKPSAPTGTPWTPMALPAISSGNYSIICLDSIILTPCSDKGRRIGLMLKIFVWKKVVYSNNFSFGAHCIVAYAIYEESKHFELWFPGDLGLARIQSDSQWKAAVDVMAGTARDAYFGGNDIFAEVGVEDLGKPLSKCPNIWKGGFP